MTTPASVTSPHDERHAQRAGLRNLRPDPRHAFADWGILICQSDKEKKFMWLPDRTVVPQSNPNKKWTLYEISEAYIKNVRWEEDESEIGVRLTNGTTSDIRKTVTYTATRLATIAAEPSYDSGLGIMGRGICFNLGGERKTIKTSHKERQRSEEVHVVLRPDETLYLYHRVFSFCIRKWWILDWDGVERVVTDNNDHTVHGWVEGRYVEGTAIATAPVTMEHTLDLVPIEKKLSDRSNDRQYARTKYQELPVGIQQAVDHFRVLASGKSTAFDQRQLTEFIDTLSLPKAKKKNRVK
ncbi:hypothetical protein RSOL_365220 [Rhizoctonia solani AG-3 Rhs1AP]|uniref:Uncharacterized protein n=2 Tax=Rhizoctonia solani AG-3 TaxID=1086053 RepID=A0A074RS63_9AGAM|nr:hypothetical protein RSOL_365220 [Rhizoctonia solani AG-3 Rhs1AP]KEP49709.1 hypothetical protein V565_094690 [Rhizoctonia solani 123E]